MRSRESANPSATRQHFVEQLSTVRTLQKNLPQWGFMRQTETRRRSKHTSGTHQTDDSFRPSYIGPRSAPAFAK
jgi:hypothetical protein